MRRALAVAFLVSTVVCAMTMSAACGSPPKHPVPQTSSSSTLSPAGISRVRAALPAGYEIGDLEGPVSAAGLWGFGAGWVADPPPCMPLADPAPTDRAARGLSASGRGGTIFVLVAAADGPPRPDVLSECGGWTMAFGHTIAEVTRTRNPSIAGADTLAWQAVARTVVESGNATITHTSGAVAYFDHHVAVVILVTDPGSPHPPLDPGFATGLLATAVTELRR